MQGNEFDKYNKIAYNAAYNKKTYKNIALKIKPAVFTKIEQFCQDVQISKTEFIVNCALYAIDNDMIDDIRAYKPRED